MEKALITGGAGFIGSHLCEVLLEKGVEVRVLDNLSTGRKENVPAEVELIEGDILDKSDCTVACKNIDTVFHLAAKVSIRHSVETFYEDAETNMMGTLNMLRSAAEVKAAGFIFASTMGVYSDSDYGILVDEKHPALPLSPYGISKLAAESYVIMMGSKLGMHCAALRLFNTYGPRQGYTPYVGVITIFVNNILKGVPLKVFGDGNQCRDFVHVRDVATAFYLSANSSASKNQIINIGTGIGTTVNQVIELLHQHFDGIEINHVEAQPNELYYSVANISAASRLLNYKPKHFLDTAMTDIIQYIKDAFNN